MVKFKNMKILVENNLDEIVGELERLGYVKQAWLNHQKEVIATFETGVYSNFNYFYNDTHNPTTIAELRSMNIETLKEMWDENYWRRFRG